MSRRTEPLLLAFAAAVVLAVPHARAQPTSPEGLTAEGLAAPPADAVAPPEDGAWHGARRPWLYMTDPTAPAPGHVIAGLAVGYAQVDRGAARPFAADVAHAGAVFDASAEVGLARAASLHAQGLLAGQGADAPVRAGVLAGASLFPLAILGKEPSDRPFDLALSAGYLRELAGGNGVWGRVAAAKDLGAARLSLSALGEHVLDPGRDGIDILLTTGACYAIGPARLGVEYVVQDLEGAWDPEEADGGIRHFVGPTASVDLAGRAQLAAGPAFGLSAGSPQVLGRFSATYAF